MALAEVSHNAGASGFRIDSPHVVYNWLQCCHLSNLVGDNLCKRFEYYTIVAFVAPAVLLAQLYFFLDPSAASGGSLLPSLNTQLAFTFFVSFNWLMLVLLQLAVGIRHNSYREEILHDM